MRRLCRMFAQSVGFLNRFLPMPRTAVARHLVTQGRTEYAIVEKKFIFFFRSAVGIEP